eukprot:TRINITY_DN7450_c0_g1_i1.p1 TRINITY_DN7450_c0_g1~~TRINITY_DN7450_c0_g1_i1.p1  ORF type:complete len:121 (+),score=6.74 TRINITY_DN7450_c0_g1_i1:838-1200(+)
MGNYLTRYNRWSHDEKVGISSAFCFDNVLTLSVFFFFFFFSLVLNISINSLHPLPLFSSFFLVRFGERGEIASSTFPSIVIFPNCWFKISDGFVDVTSSGSNLLLDCSTSPTVSFHSVTY